MALQFLGIEDATAEHLPWPDVYFTPQYGRCVEESDHAQWEVAAWEPGPILYPYLIRPVRNSEGKRLWDIVAPYGYSGPWGAEPVTPADWMRFRRAFRQACVERGIVSEFIRFHPMLQGRESMCSIDPDVEASRHGTTISIDLLSGHDGAWKQYEGRARTAIRKARQAEYTVRIRRAAEVDLPSRKRFKLLYEQAMRRVGSRSYYLFPDAYYDQLWSALSNSTALAEVLARDAEVVAAAVILEHGTLLHYHLAGSDPQHARNGINNLLLDSVAAWGIERGRTRFHLGGGLSEGDALEKFKAAMGRDRHDFWLGKTILMQDIYDGLVRTAARQGGEDVSVLLASGFFPAYRTPRAVAETLSTSTRASVQSAHRS